MAFWQLSHGLMMHNILHLFSQDMQPDAYILFCCVIVNYSLDIQILWIDCCDTHR